MAETAQDIYETTVLCGECNKPTKKAVAEREGFRIRTWICQRCKKQWLHPEDIKEYERFKELKKRQFEVKLRRVGNSWTVSIPKDIIRFEEVSQAKYVKLSLDEPGRLAVLFSKKTLLIKKR